MNRSSWLPFGKGLSKRRSQPTPALPAQQPVLARPTEPLLPWCGIEFPTALLDPMFFLLGSIGSGKTILMKTLMKAVFTHNMHGCRGFVWDPKGDALATLAGIAPENAVVSLNPLHAHCAAWDLAKDVRSLVAAQALATTLAPVDKGSSENQYFSNAVIDILAGVLTSLNALYPEKWDLNAVLEIGTNPAKLRSLLARTHDGRLLLQIYFSGRGGPAEANVISSLRVKLAPYVPAARLWARTSRRVSLEEWFHTTGQILVLASDPANCPALDALNRAIFKRASDLVLSGPEYPKEQTWFFLDEVRDLAERLEGLRQYLTRARSKGARAVLAAPDIEGLEDALNEKVAHEILAVCGNVGILRLNNPKTAEWAAKFFGSYEVIKESVTKRPFEGDSWSYSVELRESVLPQELLRFPLCGRKHGVSGVFTAPGMVWRGPIPFSWVEARLPTAADMPAFVPRPASDQERVPWGDFLLEEGEPEVDLSELEELPTELRTIS